MPGERDLRGRNSGAPNRWIAAALRQCLLREAAYHRPFLARPVAQQPQAVKVVVINRRHRADVHAGADGEGNQSLVAVRVLAGLSNESMADQMEGSGFLQACRYQAGQALSLDLASG